MNYDKGTEEAFTSLSQIYGPMSGLLHGLASTETNQFEEQLRDYVRYLASVKEILKYRLEVLGQLQAQQRMLKEKKEKMKSATGALLARLSKEIPDVRSLWVASLSRLTSLQDDKVEAQKQAAYEAVSQTCRAELERFEGTKAKEIKVRGPALLAAEALLTPARWPSPGWCSPI